MYQLLKKRALAGILFSLIVFISTAQSIIYNLPDAYLENLSDLSTVFDTTRLVSNNSEVVLIDTVNGWKKWQTVDNFYFGKNRGSLPMIADLQSLHPYFRDKIIELIQVCKASGINLTVVESYRTYAKQDEYFGMGKKYTRTPAGISRHQYGLAVDLVPVVHNEAVWDNERLWRKIGAAGERLGLRWGGRWHTPYDPAHFEWIGEVSGYQLAKGHLPKIPRTKMEVYPCLEEDIRLLQKYWAAWEVEQSVVAKNQEFKSISSNNGAN